MADIFRLAGLSDLDAVAALYLNCARAGRINGVSAWDDEYPNRSVAEEDIGEDGLFALEREGKIIAAATMREHDELDDLPFSWTTGVLSCALMRLCVDPVLQGQGIGTQMMGRITQEARNHGYGVTRLMSAKANRASTAIYRYLGYREVGEVHLYDIDFICFEHVL